MILAIVTVSSRLTNGLSFSPPKRHSLTWADSCAMLAELAKLYECFEGPGSWNSILPEGVSRLSGVHKGLGTVMVPFVPMIVALLGNCTLEWVTRAEVSE